MKTILTAMTLMLALMPTQLEAQQGTAPEAAQQRPAKAVAQVREAPEPSGTNIRFEIVITDESGPKPVRHVVNLTASEAGVSQVRSTFGPNMAPKTPNVDVMKSRVLK